MHKNIDTQIMHENAKQYDGPPRKTPPTQQLHPSQGISFTINYKNMDPNL